MSMPKSKIIFFVFILFLPIALAETQIFSGTAITDTDKVIDGNVFRFTYEPESNKVFVQTPSSALIVENGACKSNNIFRVCISRANFSYKNITTYVYYYEIGATIYKLTGSLSASGKAAPSALLQGEPSELTITISNPTDFEITNIAYIEDFTPFSVKDAKGCTSEGTQISWKGSLQSRYDKTCTALIAAGKEGAYSLSGNLSYYNGFENEKKSTDAVLVTVLPKQLKSSQITDKDFESRQPFYFNISLQNINPDEKIEASASVELPGSIALLKDVSGFGKGPAPGNLLKRTLIIEPGFIANYSFYLKALSEGKSPIRQRIGYKIKGISDFIENETVVNPQEPALSINLSAEYAELMPGQRFIVAAKIRNPGKFNDMTDIKARLDAPYNNEILQNLSRLMPNETYNIISNTLVLPNNAAEGFSAGNKTIKLNLGVAYKLDGINKSADKSLELKIKSSNVTIALSKNVTVTVKDNSQAAKEAKAKETSSGTQPIKKTGVHAETAAEKPNSGFFSKEIFLFAILALISFLVVFLAINRIRKRKKGNKEKEALNEIEKTKTF